MSYRGMGGKGEGGGGWVERKRGGGVGGKEEGGGGGWVEKKGGERRRRLYKGREGERGGRGHETVGVVGSSNDSLQSAISSRY